MRTVISEAAQVETIGKLDRVLSEMMVWSKGEMDEPAKQTLKHHCEDMIAVGNHILQRMLPVIVEADETISLR